MDGTSLRRCIAQRSRLKTLGKHVLSVEQESKARKKNKDCLPFMHFPFQYRNNKQLMHSKEGLAVLLIAMLLAHSLHALNWQGTGSGMNNTVVTEIWNNLESNLNTALGGDIAARDAFVQEISDRLNAQWNPAWNVVLVAFRNQYDAILYGYAFRDQWMWYNGVPNTVTPQFSKIVSLIVWKDYNCQDWKSVRDYFNTPSTFTVTQKATILTEARKLTQDQLLTDIWGSTHSMMTNILANSEFSSGGYSVVMAQDGSQSYFYGYVCRKGYNHYHYFNQNGEQIVSDYGNFYLFQTR